MTPGKVVTLEKLKEVRDSLRGEGKTLVLTNGCFDLLHAGHVRYLVAARALGDRLAVAVNADATVEVLKGPGRPLTPLDERMEILAALASVDYVFSFEEATPAHIVREIVPDVLVKGGDWPPEAIVGGDTVAAAGGRVVSLPYSAGYSTSRLIARIRNLDQEVD
jgi:D-beta-D-heptose 7-phosphate kinase/D-beta-D-heptose 1-phosphate adenosyltransferase